MRLYTRISNSIRAKFFWGKAQLTDVPALRDEDSDEEEEKGKTGSDPSVEDEGSRLVKE